MPRPTRRVAAIGPLGVLLILALGSLGVAAKYIPPNIGGEGPGPSYDGAFRPKTLPRTELMPVRLDVSGKLDAVGPDTYTQRLRKLTVEADADAAVNLDEFPVCPLSKLKTRDTKAAEAVCRSAIVGHGTAATGGVFPGEWLVVSDGSVVAFNGGVRGRAQPSSSTSTGQSLSSHGSWSR